MKEKIKEMLRAWIPRRIEEILTNKILSTIREELIEAMPKEDKPIPEDNISKNTVTLDQSRFWVDGYNQALTEIKEILKSKLK